MPKPDTKKTPRPIGRYELIAFLTGFSLLVLEITGGRLIAPYFGSSTYIWTATIGVILGALAVGTIVGGLKADSGRPLHIIRNTTFVAATAVFVMGLLQQPVLASLASVNIDLRVSATLAALILFALPSYLIGVIGPNLAKLNVTSLAVAGRSISRIEAASTLGSIAGTFMTGYFFLGWFGSQNIVTGVAVLLLVVSLLAARAIDDRRHYAKVWLLVSAIIVAGFINSQKPSSVIADIDTSYARYIVANTTISGIPSRVLMTDGQAYQSGVAINEPTTPVFSYTENFYDIARAVKPESALIIGGGTYTFPNILAQTFSPDVIKRIDAVEIDPALTSIAKDYFYLQDASRINIINQDGRRYLNQTITSYDTIYVDAFASLSPPFQLTTKEMVAQVADKLRPTGLAIVNVIGDYEDENGAYLRAIMATYATQFKYVSLYQSNPQLTLDGKQNFILVASDDQASHKQATGVFASPALPLSAGGLVLTDNYAPVERLTY